MFQQLILSAIVVLNCSSLSIAKPFIPESPLLRSQAFVEQSREQEIQHQDATFQPEENRNQESNVTRGLVGFLGKPSAHNRTTRDVQIPVCFKWDECRGMHVSKDLCQSEHKACLQAIPKYGKALCRTVYGFLQAKYSKNCTSIPIDCLKRKLCSSQLYLC